MRLLLVLVFASLLTWACEWKSLPELREEIEERVDDADQKGEE